MWFLITSQVLAQVGKTVYAQRNGNMSLEKERARELFWIHDLVLKPKNVESGGSWILIPGDAVTHWVTLGKSLDLSHLHWKLGERLDLTEKYMLNWHWTFLRKQITMPVGFFSILCHFAWFCDARAVLWYTLEFKYWRSPYVRKQWSFFPEEWTTMIYNLAKAELYLLYIVYITYPLPTTCRNSFKSHWSYYFLLVCSRYWPSVVSSGTLCTARSTVRNAESEGEPESRDWWQLLTLFISYLSI